MLLAGSNVPPQLLCYPAAGVKPHEGFKQLSNANSSMDCEKGGTSKRQRARACVNEGGTPLDNFITGALVQNDSHPLQQKYGDTSDPPRNNTEPGGVYSTDVALNYGFCGAYLRAQPSRASLAVEKEERRPGFVGKHDARSVLSFHRVRKGRAGVEGARWGPGKATKVLQRTAGKGNGSSTNQEPKTP